MRATTIGGYRLQLGPWEETATSVTLGAKQSDDRWDGRVVINLPELTLKDEPYLVTLAMKPDQARKLARQLTRSANILHPPTPRKKRG